MPEKLTDIEARILGSLVEKQLTTPEYYPLTLNSLITACNQKNNRDPVVSYDEATVSRALEDLRDRNLVYVFYGSTSRVPKYKHMLPSFYELEPAQVALVSVMMLRGPQTLGELRERSGRLHQFENLGEVRETLDKLMRRDEPVIAKLPPQPGQKEARFAHLLSGEINIEELAAASASARMSRSPVDNDRTSALEARVASLENEMAQMRQMFDDFRKQFE
jgi:uncharacterized protein YceH (UPF0502 family)